MITDAQFELIFVKVMALPGMRTDLGSVFMAEPDAAGTTYIKFMSDHGVTDDHNGKTFGNYMRSQKCNVHQWRPRSMVVLDADLVRLFL